MFPCEYCKIFKNSFFHRIPLVATSALHNYLSKLLPKRKFSYFVYFKPSKQTTKLLPEMVDIKACEIRLKLTIKASEKKSWK